jgi:hypothetical protein
LRFEQGAAEIELALGPPCLAAVARKSLDANDERTDVRVEIMVMAFPPVALAERSSPRSSG